MIRDPHAVPCTVIDRPDRIPIIAEALRGAVAVAIDTEVPIDGPRRGLLRVMSVATRSAAGEERAFVVDARDLDPTLMAGPLAGVTAAAWNANFDARVIDAAVYSTADTTADLTWWDAQLADALLHQGRSGFGWYHGLAWATEHYLGFEAEGKGTVQLSYTAFDDLSVDQIRYAAADAVETLWVADAIRAEIETAELEQICAIEMAARPFLDQMERTGLAFDWERWEAELETMTDERRMVSSEIAQLTGGGQGSLFDEAIEPTWNPGSEQQLRQALNTWSPDEVHRYTERHRGGARPLVDGDSMTATVLADVGGALADAVLRFRKLTKILTTYGESIREHLGDDGRIHPQYLQVVGTNTGRLASRHPNAQNFTPRMLRHFVPTSPSRVFVHADLSQAELRFLAQVSADEPLRAAFAAGVDVHQTTAATMFRIDPEALGRRDPARLAELRQIAKALNFGIAYGQGAAALGSSLTRNGTPTTTEEAQTLLAQYRSTYPGTAAWAAARDAEITALGAETRHIDWDRSLRLARHFPAVAAARRSFRQNHYRWPTATEVAEVVHTTTEPSAEQIERAAWVLGYQAPVALLADDRPFTFASRTISGRRQQFNLHLDSLFLTAIQSAVRSSSQASLRVRSRFETDHSVTLSTHGRRLTEGEIAAEFDDRPLRRLYIEALADGIGREATEQYLQRAAAERISVMTNAWRNAPIQGGVADIMLVAYAMLHRRLRAHPTARPVQTVHDSVIVECDRADAAAVATAVRECLEAASRHFCPDVTPRADVDVRRTLSDDDIIDLEHDPIRLTA